MANINVKRNQFVTELKPGFSVFKEVIPPQLGISGGTDLGGYNFSIGWSYLTLPFVMVQDAHRHDFDQAVFFMGHDPNSISDFDAEIEFSVGDNGEKHIITYPACVFIPKGTLHGPLNVKRVTKPVTFMDITFSPGYSIRPVPPDSQRK